MSEVKLESSADGQARAALDGPVHPSRGVLIIDNNEAAGRVLAIQLKDPYEVFEAVTPEEAFAFALRG